MTSAVAGNRAIAHLSAHLWHELAGRGAAASPEEWFANRAARQCWEDVVLRQRSGCYESAAACVMAVAAG